MATPSTRRSYLSDDALPSDWLQYSIGSKSLPFISTAGASTAFGEQPNTLIRSLFNRASEFKPKSGDRGNTFQKFLNLMSNPDALAQDKMQVPPAFATFSQFGQ